MDKEKEIKTQDFVADFYENVRHSKSYARRFHDYWFSEMIKKVAPRGLILDAGCGTGEMMEFLEKKGNKNFIGYDISFNMLSHAKKRADKLVCADAENLPFADNSFDIIYGRSILHHLQDVPKALREARRVLKPGGEVIFVETNKTFINDLPRRLMKHGDHFSEDHKNFKDSDILSMMKEEFEIKNVNYFGYIGYTLLGFPDMLDIYRFVPIKRLFTPLLINIDRILSLIPIVKKLSFCIMISAKKI